MRVSPAARKDELMNIQNPSMASITLNALELSSIVQAHGRDHLVLMRMVFNDDFGNIDKRNGAFEQDRRALGPDGETWNCLSFDSAMNAFPAEYYHRVTGLDKVTLTLRFAADKWRVRLMRRQGNLPPQVVQQQEGSGPAIIDMDTPLNEKSDRFYLELSYIGALKVDILAWTTPAPAPLKPLGIAITTYNKPTYLIKNLEILKQTGCFKAGMLDILVVNNGSSLEGLPEGIQVTPMNNVGGTGGFLEGHRHFSQKGYGHFVIMDDDIAIAADVADRFYALSCLSQGCHIGSLAEILNIPERIVKEQGADVSEGDVFGLHLHHHNMNLQGYDRHRIYGFREVDFSGWWSLLVDLKGPAPRMPRKQFIKRDDIMFGYESRLQGTPTVVFPNLIVAHGEEGAPTYYYYDIRNDLILRARNHPPLSISLKQLTGVAGRLMLCFHLDRQRMFNAALADFMAGPAALEKSDMGKTLGKIRGMAQKPVPLPKEAPVLGGGSRPSLGQLMLGWVRPGAWRHQEEPPVVKDNLMQHAMGRSSYYEKIPYSDTGYLRHRSLGSIFQFLRSIGLICRLAITRNGLIRAYKKEADQ